MKHPKLAGQMSKANADITQRVSSKASRIGFLSPSHFMVACVEGSVLASGLVTGMAFSTFPYQTSYLLGAVNVLNTAHGPAPVGRHWREESSTNAVKGLDKTPVRLCIYRHAPWVG